MFLDNNKTLESLTINECDLLFDGSRLPPTLLTELKFLKVDCSTSQDLKMALDSILAPQFKRLNTVTLSQNPVADIQVVATDGSDHTLTFRLCIPEPLRIHPLQDFGAEIVTLRLAGGVYPEHFHQVKTLHDFFGPLDTLRVLECEGTIINCIQILVSPIFPRLEAIRVAVGQTNCGTALETLAPGLKFRMESGNPLAAVEPLVPEGEEGLDEGLRAEWERCFKEMDISRFLSN